MNLGFATLMVAPPSRPTSIGAIFSDDLTLSPLVNPGDLDDPLNQIPGLLILGEDTKVYGVGSNTLGEIITTGTGNVSTWTAIQDGLGNDLENVLVLETSHTSEEYSGAAVITPGLNPGDTNLLYVWGDNDIGSTTLTALGFPNTTGLVQNPTIPPSFNQGVDNPVSLSVGGHAITFFNTAGTGSICFSGHITNDSTGGLTVGNGRAFECILTSDLGFVPCGIPSIIATSDDFSGSPILSSTGGNTPTVYTNDTINGVSFLSIDVVMPSITDDDGTGVTISQDGTLNVPSGLVPGTYNITYRICETCLLYTSPSPRDS